MAGGVKEFYTRIEDDVSLRDKVFAQGGSNLSELLDHIVKVGVGMGYRFTADEARDFGASLQELPDEVLDAVSAGSGAVGQSTRT